MSLKISRRSLLYTGGAGLAMSYFARGARGDQRPLRTRHTFVLINLLGGVDHSQYLPVFDANDQLSSDIHFPTQEIFEAAGLRFLNVPKVLTPNSPLIIQFASRLSILQGIQMDGQNAHNAALAVLMRGSTETSALSFAAILGELTGHDTKYGVVSFGVQPFRNSTGLTEKAAGLTLPPRLASLSEQLRLPTPTKTLSAERYVDAVTGYYQARPESDLNYSIRQATPGSDLHTFRSVFRDPNAAQRQNFIQQLSLSADYWNPYAGLAGPYGSERHEQLAMAAQLIHQGDIASCFVINIGRTEGFYSYDTHNAYTGNNDERQQEKLDRDLRAIEIFLSQIADHLETTTVIIGSEFGRPPYLNPTGGRDHWGANNSLLVFSPFLHPGLHGTVDPTTYVGNSIAQVDGSTEVFRCRGLYRGLVETIFANGLVNCETEQADRIYRQYLPGSFPRGVFSRV